MPAPPCDSLTACGGGRTLRIIAKEAPVVPSVEFGYNPPSGERGQEHIRPREFLQDLHRSLDLASQGFGSLWVSDHLNYADEFRLECWTMLSWIAARYPGPRLGTIVMSNSFRSPSLMAKMGASLQEMSSGRFILGYGAGWFQGEYDAYGFDYPSTRTRVEMLEEGVQVIRKMWTKAPASFTGKHYSISEAHCEPLPDPPPPIMIGGGGEKYTLRTVARHGDWWNDVNRPRDQLKRKLEVLREHCEVEGRDFESIRKTLAVRVYVERSHSAALELASRREGPSVAGDPPAVVDQFSELAELGFDLFILNFPSHFQTLSDVKLFMERVVPAFGARSC